ncbi:MAG: hypothetical protein PWP09_516 [Thermotogota bacterium]|nr:hypothetical protein [Thermotogota bacterium]
MLLGTFFLLMERRFLLFHPFRARVDVLEKLLYMMLTFIGRDEMVKLLKGNKLWKLKAHRTVVQK